MDLQSLRAEWTQAKTREDQYRKERLVVEEQILAMSGSLPEAGTTKVSDGLKIVTGLTVKYDQDKLMELYRSGAVSNWPFKKEFKPVAADLKYLQNNEPEQFALIEEASTVTPKKPTIKVEV